MLPLVIRSGSGILGSDDIKTRKVEQLTIDMMMKKTLTKTIAMTMTKTMTMTMTMAMAMTMIFRWRVVISGGLGAFLLLAVFESVER